MRSFQTALVGYNNLWIHVPQFGLEDLVYDYLFTSQREPHSVPDMEFFIILSLILSQLELSRIELPKLILSILMKTFDHSICPGWSILIYTPSHKAWLRLSLRSGGNTDCFWYRLSLLGTWKLVPKFGVISKK